MFDWNQNGCQDKFDAYVDFQAYESVLNSFKTSEVSIARSEDVDGIQIDTVSDKTNAELLKSLIIKKRELDKIYEACTVESGFRLVYDDHQLYQDFWLFSLSHQLDICAMMLSRKKQLLCTLLDTFEIHCKMSPDEFYELREGNEGYKKYIIQCFNGTEGRLASFWLILLFMGGNDDNRVHQVAQFILGYTDFMIRLESYLYSNFVDQGFGVAIQSEMSALLDKILLCCRSSEEKKFPSFLDVDNPILSGSSNAFLEHMEWNKKRLDDMDVCREFGDNQIETGDTMADSFMEEKLREYFDEMVVYKDLKKSNFFKSLSLPSFLRDWVLKKFEDEDGEFDIEEITEFVQTYLPKKEDWDVGIKNRIIVEYEHVKILTKISVNIDIKTQEILFTLPAFDLQSSETIIEPDVWQECKKQLSQGRECWGVVELGYRPPTERPKQSGKIRLVSFTDFCPYEVDLDYYKELRSEFTIHEWIDIILGAIDYNASGYKDEQEKRALLTRLLPFVEKRLNLIELAPKGTGKSYIYGSISKYGNLSAGYMTRAKLFYDLGKHTEGLVYNNDFIAFDEIQKMQFSDMKEMGAALQTYMENGKVSISGHTGTADAGVVLLGNIDQELMDDTKLMLGTLPSMFHDTAMLDRFHGFIKGWDIPRMTDDMKISGWGLNSEYFCTILHLLRDDASYRAIVDQIVEYPEKSDTRDAEAVKRIATAYLKLFFPNVRIPEDVNRREFKQYCLRPAIKMRKSIRRQQAILDVEYRGKDLPVFTVRDE